MRKIMQALGQKVAKVATELTQQVMRLVLKGLIERMSAGAVRAIRGLINKFELIFLLIYKKVYVFYVLAHDADLHSKIKCYFVMTDVNLDDKIKL